MSGNKKAVLDSNVIIDASNGLLSINSIFSDYNNLYSSIITYVEVLGYDFADETEKEVILTILNEIPIVELNIIIADIAIEYRKKSKIKLPDALILAIAKSKNADLITSNISDFINIDKDIRVIKPKKNN